MSVTLKKDSFLSNPKDKQRLVSMLSKALQNEESITHYTNGDVDLLMQVKKHLYHLMESGKSLMIKYFPLQRTCRLPQNRFFS